MKKRKCVAMLLAGGQGARLFSLTTRVAKPAVAFGAKYRIIDFTLSNCTNSNIDTVGVLTQYQPLVLNEYIGNGEPWDLDRSGGGVHTLSPYQAKDGGKWYKGTANAIYQNVHFLEEYDSDHVLILSGDHIYKMDYSKMLDDHIANNADCTIAVIDVPMDEASRFGILDFNDKREIVDFAEKPKVPKSNHASMGIYIFKKSVLLDRLEMDDKNENSSKDFGKDVLPKMLSDKLRLFAYSFDGYWKDVGTITSLWEANMDMLGDNPPIDLSTGAKIFSRNEPLPPSYIGKFGEMKNSIMTTGCEINGTVINSVLGERVKIGAGSVIKNSVIMRGTVIKDNVSIDYGMIDEDVVVDDGAIIGDGNSSKLNITLIGRNNHIEKGKKIASAQIID